MVKVPLLMHLMQIYGRFCPFSFKKPKSLDLAQLYVALSYTVHITRF